MDEKLYKIKKGSEFEFYSTEASGTINKIVGETTQETETASLITVDEYSQVELDRDDTMRKVSIESTLDDITQATREGYNFLINNLTSKTVNGVEFTVLEDKSILVNGTATDAAAVNILNDSIGAESTSSILCEIPDDVTNGVLSGCPAGGSNSTYKIDLWSTISSLVGTDYGDGANLNFTIAERRKIDRARIIIYAGTTVNNLVFKPMIISGTESKEYEQYGASPSLDYPSEFKNIISVPTIQNSKKNIFDTTNINTKLSNLNFISKVDGGLNINGTPTSTWIVIKTQNLTVPINVGTSLYFNYGKTNQLKKDNTDFTVFIRLLDKDNGILYTLNKNYSTVVVEHKIYKIAFGIQSLIIDKSYNEDIYLELEISNVEPTQFEKYIGYSKQITLPEGQFLGNFKGYKNYIKDNKLYRNLKMIEFDGTEDWIVSNNFFYVQNISDYKRGYNQAIGICNYFPVQSNVGAGGDIKDNHVSFYGGGIGAGSISRIYVRCSYFEGNLDNFKAWLAEKYAEGNPLKICYMLENEAQEELSETNKEDLSSIELFDGTNNIFCENGIISFYPYADMPSLERPSPIESISGDYNINIHGENFLQDQYNTTDLSRFNWCFYIKANLKPDTTYTISLIGAIDNIYYVSEQLAVGGGYGFLITMTGERQSITFTTKSDISGAYNSSKQMYNIFKNAKLQPHEHIFKDVMLVEGSVAKDYVPYVSSTTTIELPEGVELNKLNLEDYVKQDGTITINSKRIVFTGTENFSKLADGDDYNEYSLLLEGSYGYDVKSNYFNNISPNRVLISGTNSNTLYVRVDKEYNLSTLELFKSFLADKYEEDTPVEIVVNLNEPTKSVLPTTEVTKMQLFPVIIGENHLVAPSEMVLLYYDEREEEEDIQPITITNEGKLLPFNLLVDYNKTDLPLIAEAIEASQTITGADGDLVLDTTYGSRLFEIDAVTDDFLTPEQKEAKREEIREFLNSIKKVNTKLIIEPQNRTYEVKYAGLAEDTNLPKCVEFIIPLKSASPYAISNETYILNGEGDIESETKEPTGFVCTISGPANYPELSLNGYLMSYENVILEGEKLIIDTKKSTVTKVNIRGVKTNAMAYYNHQFPKIQEGTNVFTIISGIDEDKLKIEWNDLLL